MSEREPVTYASYLRLDDLLDLQQPRSEGPEHDEMLFIVIHQVYELWFKQMIHEFGRLRTVMIEGEVHDALATFKRVRTILKVSQIDVLETMTPLSFVSFRDHLESGSGFQSAQFREFEYALGLRHRSMLDHHEGTPAHARLAGALEQPSLWDAFLRLVHERGYPIPDDVLERDVRRSTESDERVQASLVRVYREDPELASVCERMVDLDEGIQEWRYRHVKMVERTIGTKSGTGGSPGASYLRQTLFRPLFPDLWAIRVEF